MFLAYCLVENFLFGQIAIVCILMATLVTTLVPVDMLIAPDKVASAGVTERALVVFGLWMLLVSFPLSIFLADIGNLKVRVTGPLRQWLLGKGLSLAALALGCLADIMVGHVAGAATFVTVALGQFIWAHHAQLHTHLQLSGDARWPEPWKREDFPKYGMPGM